MGLHSSGGLARIEHHWLAGKLAAGACRRSTSSAAQIQAALRKNPDSPWLMGQLRQIYSQDRAVAARIVGLKGSNSMQLQIKLLSMLLLAAVAYGHQAPINQTVRWIRVVGLKLTM